MTTGLPITTNLSGVASAVLNSKIYIMGGLKTYDTTVTSSNMFSSAAQIENGGYIESQITPLAFTADRAQIMVWSDYATKQTDANATQFVAAVNGQDWTNYVSLDGGTNWIALTNMSLFSTVNATNLWSQTITNGITSGNTFRQAIGIKSGTVVRVKGWMRFAGQQ
jgi:hypothetical protein